jgi:hypothetical protein
MPHNRIDAYKLAQFSNATAIPINSSNLINLLRKAYTYLYISNNDKTEDIPRNKFAELIGVTVEQLEEERIFEQQQLALLTRVTTLTQSPMASPTPSPMASPTLSDIPDHLLDVDDNDDDDDDDDDDDEDKHPELPLQTSETIFFSSFNVTR